MQAELRTFVFDALRRNATPDTIRTELNAAGWPKKNIDDALASYVASKDITLGGIPVPRRKPAASARETMQYVLLFLCLCISATAVGDLAFNAIDAWVADQYGTLQTLTRESISWSLAALIVALPAFLLLSRAATKALEADPVRREAATRHWTVYAMLGLTGAVGIVDLIGLVSGLIAGTGNLNPGLKAAVVLFLAGGIFAHYYVGLKKEEVSQD